MKETEKQYIERIKAEWNKDSDTWYLSRRTDEAIKKIIEKPESSFHPTVISLIRKYMPDLKDKHILVPSSGDNHAVFSFALMGAKVTSSDISERQLENSKSISDKYKWDIEYVLSDTMLLDNIESEKYDFVYTSNGVHVWIYNLESMYKSIFRVIKKSGMYMMFDIHPFLRPFEYKAGEQPKIKKPYTDTSPYFHWRIQDLMNSMISAGFYIKRVEEMYAEDGSFWDAKNDIKISKEESDRLMSWETNPMAALPQWLCLCTEKKI